MAGENGILNGSEQNGSQTNGSQEIKQRNGSISIDIHPSTNLDSPDKSKEYESSELSDLGDDQSEAETDKMDFLDEENSNPDNVSDLNALSKLTELARLKEIDSDDDLEDKPEVVKNGRRSDTEVEESPVKKLKTEEKEATPLKLDGSEVEIEDVDDKATVTVENGEPVVQVKKPTGKDGVEHESNHEDEHEDEEDEEEDHESGNEDDEKEDEEDEEEDDDDEEEEQEEERDENGVDLNEQRLLAIDDLITIEKSFAEIKDKMYQDKLKFLEQELQLCLEGSHPELARIYYKINGFYQDSIRLANHTLNYRLRCINNETIATRTSIHQDFMKNMMDCKNDMISDTTSKWYKINKERNQMDQLVPDYAYTAVPEIQPLEDHLGFEEVPQLSKKEIKHTRVLELVQQRNDLNQELGIINGLVQLHGFPSAISLSSDDQAKVPELLLKKATDEEIAEDFIAMGIPI